MGDLPHAPLTRADVTADTIVRLAYEGVFRLDGPMRIQVARWFTLATGAVLALGHRSAGVHLALAVATVPTAYGLEAA